MQHALPDGYNLNVEEVGSGFPLIVLHGGPGLDHSMFRPYLDALGDEYRVLYVDERGQGRSQRVDPATLSLEVFARDVDLLAETLELESFALLGHSFGAIIATWHATEFGTAVAYVISAGGESSDALDADVQASLDALGADGKVIASSWEAEKTVETEAELKQLLRDQLPFHFHGDPPPGYAEETVGSPEVLRYFANMGYGAFDYRRRLKDVDKPTLVIVGEYDRTTTPRAAGVLHEGIPNSELVVIPSAGHMTFVEQTEVYLAAVRRFLSGIALQT
ncbi:MAG: alpha/beta fold hydrolase [Actinobacteria bacterium]|nr:MAG: alpha/beta fold hydrolase [Actinomycetota bacterium]